MPHFYFHVQNGQARLEDRRGVALPDAEAAWYQAVRSARELIVADRRLGSGWTDQAVEIEDETGAPVAQIPLQDIVNYAT